MKKYVLAFSALGLVVMTACGDNSKKNNEPEVVEVSTTEVKVYAAAPTEVTFNDPKVADVYQNYINLKTALVNTDAAKTAVEASKLMTAFANVGVENDVLMAAETMSKATDVEVQREAFVAVTGAVEKLLEGALASGTIYKQFCPMAFDFKGAFWLSNSKQIANPYFGDKMLRCGKIDSEIK